VLVRETSGATLDALTQSRLEPLRALGELLQNAKYEFTAVTPETQRRNLRRRPALASNLRDVFGWNRPFERDLLPQQMFELLRAADALHETTLGLCSRVRFSTLAGRLFVSSGFPTEASDAVFFGPDTYRFCALLERWAPFARRAVDIGCGSGAGGLCLGARVSELNLVDVNPRALDYARVNAALAGHHAHFACSDVLAGLSGEFDLIIANPPYMNDAAHRVYRDGGARHGSALTVRIVRESLQRLAPGGTLILYSGAPIVGGRDVLREALHPILEAFAGLISYEELDPDVFGEELEQPGYEEVERIAVVALRVRRSGA
jgi:release factor glutamine methyltransferase